MVPICWGTNKLFNYWTNLQFIMKICSKEIGDQGDLVDAKSKHLCVKSLNSYFLPNSSRILKEAANMCWGATMTRSKEGLWWEQNPAVKEEVEEKKILLVLSWVLLSIALIGTTQCGLSRVVSFIIQLFQWFLPEFWFFLFFL